MPVPRRILALLLGLTAFLATPLPAEPPAVEFKNPWIRAVPPGSAATAGFLVIVNRGDAPLQLTAAKSDVSGEVKPMITTRKTVDGQDVAGMEFVDHLTIPARGKLVLEPGGDHLMFLRLGASPQPGTPVDVTVEISGQSFTIPFDVRKK